MVSTTRKPWKKGERMLDIIKDGTEDKSENSAILQLHISFHLEHLLQFWCFYLKNSILKWGYTLRK